MQNPKLTVINGHPTTTSFDVARFFNKNHKDVTRAIRNVLPYLSDDFNSRNFARVSGQEIHSQINEIYRLTRSGFAMIALGFTGEKAIRFREAYINRFDQMEAELHQKQIRKIERDFVEDKYLPFDEPVMRPSVPVGLAVKHLHILGHYLDWTPARMKGMLKRGELDGLQDSKGHWRVFNDQITKLVGGETDA